MSLSVGEFHERLTTANLGDIRKVHFQNEQELANEIINLSLMGLFYKPTDLKDDMPLFCRIVQISIGNQPPQWHYIIPVEHMNP